MPAEVDSMAYTGEAPWHGEGTYVEGEAMTSKQALELGGLNNLVIKVPLLTQEVKDDKGEIIIPGGQTVDSFATWRTDRPDTGYLGTVGSGYTVFQNSEAFEFFDHVVGSKEAFYHTVGALRGGRKVWILAKLPGELRVEGTDDITDKYLLLANSHDGTSAIRMFFTPVRVVCNNTLQLAMRGGLGQGISIKHTRNAGERISEAREALGLATVFYNKLDTIINQLAHHEPTAEEIDKVFFSLIPDVEDEDKSVTRRNNQREKLYELFEAGVGNDIKGIKGTSYAMLNATTEYADWHRGIRVTDGREEGDVRLEGIWFGSAAKFKAQAFNTICDVAGVDLKN